MNSGSGTEVPDSPLQIFVSSRRQSGRGSIDSRLPGVTRTGHERCLARGTGSDAGGGADALNDLLAGTVHFMNDPTCNPSAKAGKLDMLCVNHSTRSPEFPDAPTLTEAGYPNSDVPLWFCIWAPARMPQPIVEALHAKVTEISKAPDVPPRLLLSGSLPVTSTQAELLAFRDAEWKTTSDLIKAANIKLE